MATEVNIADMNSIPEIYLWVPTTLPISIYTQSLMIYLNNCPIYLKNLVKKPGKIIHYHWIILPVIRSNICVLCTVWKHIAGSGLCIAH